MSVQVDFYVLEANRQRSLLFACHLLEKIHVESKKIFVYTASPQDAEQFDNLLWTYKDDSFLPHQIYNAEDKFTPTIQISHEIPVTQHEILLNLTAHVPEFYLAYLRLIEIVYIDAEVQAIARERYRQYRDAGCKLNTIKLKAHEL